MDSRNGEIKLSKFKRICVFCGSSPGKKTTYQDAAMNLGNELVCIYYYTHILIFVFLATFFNKWVEMVYMDLMRIFIKIKLTLWCDMTSLLFCFYSEFQFL